MAQYNRYSSKSPGDSGRTNVWTSRAAPYVLGATLTVVAVASIGTIIVAIKRVRAKKAAQTVDVEATLGPTAESSTYVTQTGAAIRPPMSAYQIRGSSAADGNVEHLLGMTEL